MEGTRDPDAAVAAPSRVARGTLVAFAAIVLVGLVNVPLPFTGDQALFAVGADALKDGAVLYRDFWDQKQPGIYLLYTTVGLVGGVGEVSFHLAELLWWLGVAAAAAVLLRPHLRTPWVATLAPALVVVPYLAGARPLDLGQVEVLVALPLVLALLALDDTRGPVTGRRWLAAGLAAGAVVLLKHFYVLIVLVWAARTLWRTRHEGGWWRGPAWMAGGLGLVFLPVAVYFTAYDLWDRIWWTYFEYSPGTTSLDPRPIGRLARGVSHLVITFAPLFLLALAGLVWRWRRREQRLVGDALVWFVVGGGLVLMQSWWSYHFLLLYAPVALLAVVGLDELCRRWQGRQRAVAFAVLALASLPLAAQLADKGRALAGNDLGLTAAGRAGIADDLGTQYEEARPEAAFLDRPDARQGDVYVFGNPLILFLSGRGQAIAVHGWSPEFNDDELWAEIRTDLASARPPYVFVNEFSRDVMTQRSPAMVAFLREHYDATPRATGTWYTLRS